MFNFTVRPALVTLHFHGGNDIMVLVSYLVHQNFDGEGQALLEGVLVCFKFVLQLVDSGQFLFDFMEREVLILAFEQQLIDALQLSDFIIKLVVHFP